MFCWDCHCFLLWLNMCTQLKHHLRFWNRNRVKINNSGFVYLDLQNYSLPVWDHWLPLRQSDQQWDRKLPSSSAGHTIRIFSSPLPDQLRSFSPSKNIHFLSAFRISTSGTWYNWSALYRLHSDWSSRQEKQQIPSCHYLWNQEPSAACRPSVAAGTVREGLHPVWGVQVLQFIQVCYVCLW